MYIDSIHPTPIAVWPSTPLLVSVHRHHYPIGIHIPCTRPSSQHLSSSGTNAPLSSPSSHLWRRRFPSRRCIVHLRHERRQRGTSPLACNLACVVHVAIWANHRVSDRSWSGVVPSFGPAGIATQSPGAPSVVSPSALYPLQWVLSPSSSGPSVPRGVRRNLTEESHSFYERA